MDESQQRKEGQGQQGFSSLLTLVETLSGIPEGSDMFLPEETLLQSSDITDIAQHLVDLVRQVLDCSMVFLMSVAPVTDQVHFVAMSGLTVEQGKRRREVTAGSSRAEFLSAEGLGKIWAHGAGMITGGMFMMPD